MVDRPPDFRIERLGETSQPSPLKVPEHGTFVRDDERVFVDPRPERVREMLVGGFQPPTFALAGPRERLRFAPRKTRAAIVTCGGICPGLNDVVRALVIELAGRYGVASVQGVRFGYSGLRRGAELQPLDPASVEDIHL